jgi:hypothetical protein
MTDDELDRIISRDTPDECELILELNGAPTHHPEREIRTLIDAAIQERHTVEFSNNQANVIYERDRADYEQMQQLKALNHYATITGIEDGGMPALQIARIYESSQDLGDRRLSGIIDDADPEVFFQSERESDTFLKPGRDAMAVQTMMPRPQVVLELQYDVPRRGSLDSVVDDVEEFTSEGLMGQVGRLEVLEDRDTIMVIPLGTLIDVDDYSLTDFDTGGIVSQVVENTMGETPPNLPVLEKITAACITVGR